MSTEESSYGSLMKLLQKLEAARNDINAAKTPDQIQAAEAALVRVTNQLKNTWSEVDEDVRDEFSKAYREAGGIGAPDRRYREKAWRSRKKSTDAFNRSADGIKTWGLQFSANTRSLRARQSIDAQIKKLEVMGGPAAEIQKLKNLRATIPDGTTIRDEPQVTYHRRKGGSYTVNARHHMRMSVATSYGINRNMGTVAAAAKGSGYVIVSDGPDCGKKGHNSGDKANGAIWTVDEAFSYPLSHPSCQRSFIVADGPPGSKKLKQQLKAMKAAAATEKKKSAGTSVAQALAGASIVASIAGTIVTNPFIKSGIREILADQQLVLGEFTRKILNGLVSYAKKESIAFEMHGQKLGVKTQSEFNQKVLRSFDEDLANEKFINMGGKEFVTLRAEQAQVLGIPFRAPKDVVLRALDDYGDWTLHRDFMDMPLENRLGVRQMWRDVNGELHRDAALKFHIDKAPGVQLDRSWTRVLKDFQAAYAKDPEKANIELIRLSAAVLDPTPWVRATFPNNFHFTVGMPSKARQDLAEKVYRKASGLGTLTQREIDWAKDLGMDLKTFKEIKFGREDVIDLLTPRLTYQPGGIFHATLGMESGVLKPIIRLYPRGSVARYISLEQRLGRLDVKEFIRQLQRVDTVGTKPERIFNALAASKDADFVSSINLFRNSPLEVSLKMLGAHPTGAALRILPDNAFLRYSYHFTFDNTAYYMAMKMEDLRLIADSRGMTGTYRSKDQLVRSLRTWDGVQRRKFMAQLKSARQSGENISELMTKMSPEVRRAFFAGTDGWQEGVNVLPNRNYGFNLHNISLSHQEIILKLRVAGYSALRIAKETRYGYDTVLEIIAESKVKMNSLKAFTKEELDSIHSFKELGERVNYRLGLNPSRVDRSPISGTDLGFADEILRDNPVIRGDLMRFKAAWAEHMPGIAIPEIRVSDLVYHPMMERDGIIYIRSDVVEEWGLYGKLRRKGVQVGHFPADTYDPTASLFHEAAHTIISKMSRQDRRELMLRVINEYKTWPGKVTAKDLNSADFRFIERWFDRPDIKEAIAKRVSGYGSTNVDEMLAEAFSEYMTSPAPRRAANTVGDYFRENAPINPSSIDLAKVSASEKRAANTANARLYQRLMDQVGGKDKIFAEEALSETKDWWWIDDPSFDMDDLEVEKVIADHPEISQDVATAYKMFKKQFPDVKTPRFARFRYSEENPSGAFYGADSLNMSSAFYYNKAKTVYIPEVWFDNYGDAVELRARGTKIGWNPEGTIEQHNIMVHEMGHYIHYSMKPEQLSRSIEWIAENIAETGSAVQYDLLDQAERLVGPGIKNISMQELVETMNQVLASSGNFPRGMDLVSDYGATSFTEYFAELFSLGMKDIEIGNTRSKPAQFIQMLQGLGLGG